LLPGWNSGKPGLSEDRLITQAPLADPWSDLVAFFRPATGKQR